MTSHALTAAQKFLIEPLLFSGRTTAYVAIQTGLDHPADAPLTQEQRDYLEPLIVKATTTAAIARQTGLPAAVVEAWRKQRGRLARIERKRLDRRSREVILGRPGAPASDRLLAALTAHMPPLDEVWAPVGRCVVIGREMAA